MHELIAWGPKLVTGVTVIDNDHRKLVDMLNRLNKAMAQGQSKDMLGGLLNELVDYTVQHFRREEQLMQRCPYPGAAAHVAEHKKLVGEVGAFKAKLQDGQALISIELMRFLRSWLTEHILQSDQALAKAILASAPARV